MITLESLKEIFFWRDKGECPHSYPKTLSLVDTVDREGKINRVYFCTECKEYGWKDVSRENWDAEFLSRLKKDKYYVHSALEELAIYQKSFKGVFGKSGWPLSKTL